MAGAADEWQKQAGWSLCAAKESMDALGSSSAANFIVSRRQSDYLVETVCLCRAASFLEGDWKDKHCWGKENMLFFVEDLRAREEAIEPGGFVRFLQALPRSCFELALLDVNLVSSEELCALRDGFMSSHLYHLSMNHVEQTYSSTEPACVKAVICEALKEVGSLLILTITLEESSFIDDSLVSLFSHRSGRTISELELQIASRRGLINLPRFFTSLAENSFSLTELCMIDRLWTISSFKEWAFMLSTNTSIKYLGLKHFGISEEELHMLFTSLENNLTLTSLNLSGCRGKGLSTPLLLDCLQANGILQQLILVGTPLDGNALIEAQLESNSGNARRLKLMHQQNTSTKVQPRGARLFFCGFPYSGKTTLSKTLVSWSKTTLSLAKSTPSRSCATSCFPCVRNSVQDRTRGIEVSFLEKDGLKVSLWDLAGQPEYHSLHDHMFPNLSDRATPSLFVFVWNPIQLDPKNHKVIINENGRVRKKSTEMFKDECKYWLKFISSKTQKSEKYKPTVFIVLSRGDLTSNRTKSLVEDTLINLQKEFADYVHFPTDGVYEVDAREYDNVEQLALAIFSHVKVVLASAPSVYKACELAREEFSRLVQTKLIAPLVAKKYFSVLCRKFLGITSEEMQEAIADSLNNSGDLIYLNSVDCVVMDTHWFCHEIMGGLLDQCVKNQCTDGTIEQGFFPIQFLERLLESEVNRTTGGKWKYSRKLKFSKVRGEDLVKLLVGVRLACSLDNSQEKALIFIPASLYKTGGEDIDPRKYFKTGIVINMRDKRSYVGRRLSCKDSNFTFFTPGIFYRLQVMLKNIFSARQVEVRLDENVIAFACDAVEVFIEFCSHRSEDHFMDILIHSHENLENTLEWVHEEVTDRMVKACADKKGIQGVELVQAAILPACVERCHFLKDRRPHATPVEILKDTIIRYLEKKGFQLTFKDGFRNVMHTWQSTKDVIRVVDILGEVETLKVVESYTHSLSVAAEESLNTTVKGTNFTMSKSLEKQLSFSSTMLSEEASSSNLVQHMHKDLGSKIDTMHKDLGSKIDNMHKDLGSKIDNLRKDLQNEFENLRNDVLPRLVEKMNQLLNERKLGELPRMYVVTRNDGHMGRKLLATIVPGLQNVRLELLCERQGQPHFVDGKHGLTFTTLDGVVKHGLPYIYAFLQTANVLVKVAAHVAVGLGDNVPDFTKVLASIVDTPEFLSSSPTWLGPVAPLSASNSSTSRTNFHESQQWLREVLSNYKCNTDVQIRKVFGLSRSQYRNGEIAWLCEEHKCEGDHLPI